MNTKNLVFLVGRLVADPSLSYTSQGTAIANFAVAVNRTIRQADGFKDSLDGFFDCELWGGQAVPVAETCKKGSEIQLSGSLRQKKFHPNGDKSRTISRVQIRVESIAPALEVKKAEEAPTPEQAQSQPA